MTTSIESAVRGALIDLWTDVINIIPELVAALVILVIGLIVAAALGRAARRLVQFLHVDQLAERMNVHETLGKMGLTFTFSDVFGTIVKWFFIVVFLNAAVEILGWTQIITFLNDVLRYIPQVLVAVIILAIGLIVASFVEGAITRALTSAGAHVKSPETLAALGKWAVVAFAVMASVSQLGVAQDLIAILFSAVLFTFVLAFGLAGKDKAAKFLDKVLP